jgi:hypothetical protein
MSVKVLEPALAAGLPAIAILLLHGPMIVVPAATCGDRHDG